MKVLLLLLSLYSFMNAGVPDLEEKLGAMVPMNLKFIDYKGEEKTLKQLMHGKPALLTLNYYRCAGICTTELVNLGDALCKADVIEGVDYQAVAISFAEDESPELATKKRRTIFRSMPRAFTPTAWSFAIGTNGSSRALADAVGFHFKKSDLPSEMMQYTHNTGVIVLSAEGKITRYLRGVNQLPVDIQMAVIDAKKGKTSPSISKKLAACGAFHPKEKYVAPTEEIVGVVISVLAIALFITLWLIGRRNRTTLTKEEYYKKEEEKDKMKKGDDT